MTNIIGDRMDRHRGWPIKPYRVIEPIPLGLSNSSLRFSATWTARFLSICLTLAPFGVVSIESSFAQNVDPNKDGAPKVQTGIDVNAGTVGSPTGAAYAASTSVEKQWSDFLEAEGKKNGQSQFVEGENRLPDGRILIYQSGVSAVAASQTDSRFIAARNTAFESSELQAKQKLAEFVATVMKSDRGLTLAQQGAEDAPPMIQQALSPISIAKKVAILTDKALDEQIKQFEPQWDGTGKTPEQKQAVLVTEQSQFRSNIAAHARLFTSGAFTIANFEGPNEDGKYAVLTGLIWSPRLANVATSIYSPGAAAQAGTAGGPSLKQQLEAMFQKNPDVYAISGGARIWRDEDGHFSIIAFGSAPASSISEIDRDRATLKAKAYIQQFCGETIETGAEAKDAFTRQETTQGTRTFNDDSFHRNIDARAKDMSLNGAFTLGQWRGEHPAGKVRMQVIVMAWSPTSAQSAARLSSALQSQEHRMQSQSADPTKIGNGGAHGVGEIAAPVRSGATADTSDY